MHDVANVKFELAVDDCARNAYIYDLKILSRVVVPAAAFLEAETAVPLLVPWPCRIVFSYGRR